MWLDGKVIQKIAYEKLEWKVLIQTLHAQLSSAIISQITLNHRHMKDKVLIAYDVNHASLFWTVLKYNFINTLNIDDNANLKVVA
jgi:hypothetical protein